MPPVLPRGDQLFELYYYYDDLALCKRLDEEDWGEASERPIWELLSDKPARAVKDLTHLLHPDP